MEQFSLKGITKLDEQSLHKKRGENTVSTQIEETEIWLCQEQNHASAVVIHNQEGS